MQIAHKKNKIVENVLLDFWLEMWYYIYRGKKEIQSQTYRMECRTMRRKLNKKHLVEFIVSVMGWLCLIWIIASVIDTDLHNTTPNPIYTDWNIFNILFN
mgnify:FL=1